MSFRGLIAHCFLSLNNILLYTYTGLAIHSPICESWLLPIFGTMNKLLCICGQVFLRDINFHPCLRTCQGVLLEYLSFCKNCQNVFQSGCYFAFPPAMNENFYFSTFSPAFGVLSVLDFSRYNSCIVVFHYFNWSPSVYMM